VPALTFEPSARFALAYFLAVPSSRKVSVARACGRFPVGSLHSNETYHVWFVFGFGPGFIPFAFVRDFDLAESTYCVLGWLGRVGHARQSNAARG
jgi:hypothetical protein